MLTYSQWGKDKTPSAQGGFETAQPYSPQSAQTPGGFPGTPTFYPQYGGEFRYDRVKCVNTSADCFEDIAQYGGQPGNYGGPQTGSPAGYGGSPMGYGGPQSAGGYGRGQQPNPQWAQPPPGQNFNNGFGGYQP